MPKCLKNGSWSEKNLECKAKKTFRLIDEKKSDMIIYVQKTTSTVIHTTRGFDMAAMTTTTTTTESNSFDKPTNGDTTPQDIPSTTPSFPPDDNNNNYQEYNITYDFENENDTDFFYVVEEQPN